MGENRSLEEFAAGDAADDTDDADANDPRSEPTTAPDTEPDPDPGHDPERADDDTPDGDTEAVEPLTGVYDWTPGGAACAACGDTVETRWREDDELVCPACKTW